MLPFAPVNDVIDGHIGNAEPSRQGDHGHFMIGISKADAANVVLGQLGMVDFTSLEPFGMTAWPTRITRRRTPLPCLVGIILRLRSCKEMIGSATERHVAVVADIQALRDCPMGEEIRKAVSVPELTLEKVLPATSSIHCCLPKPTTVCGFINECPKAGNVIANHRALSPMYYSGDSIALWLIG